MNGSVPRCRGLVDLFDAAQSLVPTPKLLQRDHIGVALSTPYPLQKKLEARKPPRSIALDTRASTQLVRDPELGFISTSLGSPSSPRHWANSRSAGTPSGVYLMPSVSPYLYNTSQSTPALSSDRRGSLSSAATTPSGSSRRLSSSLSDRRRSPGTKEREKKCLLQ